MLFQRHKLRIVIVLLSIIGKLSAQEDSEYYGGYSDEGRDYHSDYSPDTSNPSEPLQQGPTSDGFVSPIDFSSFISTPDIDFHSASTYKQAKKLPMKLLPSRDYFDEAQVQTDEVIKPGPNYISHRVPAKFAGEIAHTKPTDVGNADDIAKEDTRKYERYIKSEGKLTPYQKYSFQPAESNQKLSPEVMSVLQNTAPVPYRKLEANVPKCVKIHKKVTNMHAKFVKQPMTCYMCKDPETGGNYEECSFTSFSKPKATYMQQVRNKREDVEGEDVEETEESPTDPYEEIKRQSHDYYSKPSDFEKDFYKAPDFNEFEPYQFDANKPNDGEAEEKSYSEQQSEELLKKGENCHKEVKDGATCVICKNPKDGGNYQQCSYESEPQEKKYAYVRESKYNGAEEPEEKMAEESSPKNAEIRERSSLDDEVEYVESKDNAEEWGNLKEEEQAEEEDHGKYNPKEQHDDFDPKNFDSKYLSEPDEEEKTTKRGPQKFTTAADSYHQKIFPQESKQETQNQNPYDDDQHSKKDVEDVLEEFAKKDRSHCQHVYKKGMTCYLCVDKKGVKQEECMYVSESKPKSTHLAYHQLEKTKSPENLTEAASQAQPPKIVRRKSRIFPKTLSTTTANPAFDSKSVTTKMAARIVKRQVQNEKVIKNDPEPEFNVNDEGGYFSSETVPVFSKRMGFYLPKYVVDKSEDEIDFDRSVRANGGY